MPGPVRILGPKPSAPIRRQVGAPPLRLYRNPAMLGALEALFEAFPATAAVVGERRFEALALAYARLHPPAQPLGPRYGDGFPDWLADEQIAREMPCLADLSRCEKLHRETTLAADEPVLTPRMLKDAPPDRVLSHKLQLHQATRFAWFQGATLQLFEAHHGGGPIACAALGQPSGVLFTRPCGRTLINGLDSPGHRLLGGVRLGESLGAAAQAASLLFPGTSIADCFSRLVEWGAFNAFG